MTLPKSKRVLQTIALVGLSALLLGGCRYDYLQHTDRVAYSAGDAVKANLESATIDPSSDEQYDVSGLGKNGQVVSTQADDATSP